MRTSRFVIAAALLGAAACGGGEGQGIDPTVVVSGSAGQLKPLAGASRSWMSPLAQNSSALLYVSDSQNSEVAVFIYRSGTATKLVGRLTGFDPTSECVGPGGDVFITSGANIYQFTHGGTKPIAVLKDDFGYSVGCAVDPVTRNLAVANSYDLNSSPGSVLIYPKASGKPRQYFVSNVENPEYCSYDNSGNLYVDGYDISVNLALGKLPAQSKAFEAISVNGARFYWPKSMQWVTPYLLVDDSAYGFNDTSAIYKLKVAGSTATVAGTTRLQHSGQIEQFWKDGLKIVTAQPGLHSVPVYRYPSGALFRKIPNGTFTAYGVVVSPASR